MARHRLGRKAIEPQYLMSSAAMVASGKSFSGPKVGYMRISSSTNARTTISTYLRGAPAGDSVFFFVPDDGQPETACVVSGVLSSFAFDTVIRQRLGGLNMSEFVMVEAPLPLRSAEMHKLAMSLLFRLALGDRSFAQDWVVLRRIHPAQFNWRAQWALTPASRLEQLACFNALVAVWYGLAFPDVLRLFDNCDWPSGQSAATFDVKGFWRIDRDRDPELRSTVLTLVAFYDLQEKIRACSGDRVKGIEAFLAQNQGEGWMLPETLRLADYGLGHDDRAKQPQPVASRMGPRFYDWQLAQTAEESWRECHLHARNLLGEAGYRQLVADLAVEQCGSRPSPPPASGVNQRKGESPQGSLF